MQKAIVLLPGGLDSLVSCACLNKDYSIVLALTFDYGQKSFKQELRASRSMCKHCRIEHKVIKLDWLKNIAHTSLVSKSKIPNLTINDLGNDDLLRETSKSVWIPNRNALFVNIVEVLLMHWKLTLS